MKPYFETQLGKLFHGDCLAIKEHLDPVDLVLTDPPYGINFDFKNKRSRKTGLDFRSDIFRDPEWSMVIGDDKPFDPSPWIVFKNVVLWGANNFSSNLPDSRGWLIWDKLGDKKSCAFGDCELAWTNKNMSTRIHRQLWRGLVREGEENVANSNKFHPCQKPIRLMMWCLGFFEDCLVTLDPYSGSGTTLAACERLGRRWIGVEIEEKYCEIAAKRIENETRQLKLF